ncbi:MAG: MBL fold metallo-hydrolase, partial [Candidatus Woesearchaeota archaeon]|nr:MBL fold metallo-hydrolase [Candidatus Woesearchaeota archaeon]
MEITVIASGSNGNCCLVEDRKNSILIDAGKSCREIDSRMNQLGKSLENVDAIIITHSHHDHISGAGIISRMHGIPLYMSKETFEEANRKIGDSKIKHFSQKPFRVGDMEIRPIQTSHNVSSCGFAIGGFGLFTDTGIVTKQMQDILPKLKGVLLESNHDIDMLINGRYPAYLKQWILSDVGHLSNIHASEFIQEKGKNLSLVLLGHLSGNNNTPAITRKTFETLVKRKIDYDVCSRDKASGKWII